MKHYIILKTWTVIDAGMGIPYKEIPTGRERLDIEDICRYRRDLRDDSRTYCIFEGYGAKLTQPGVLPCDIDKALFIFADKRPGLPILQIMTVEDYFRKAEGCCVYMQKHYKGEFEGCSSYSDYLGTLYQVIRTELFGNSDIGYTMLAHPIQDTASSEILSKAADLMAKGAESE